MILEQSLDVTLLEVLTRACLVPSRKQACQFLRSIRAYARGLPLAYVTGQAYFAGKEFAVSPGVFIPRPDTEVLLHQVKAFLRNTSAGNPGQPLHVVDLCTGTGNIAVCLASAFENIHVWAVDICPLAVAMARKNACAHRVEGHVSVLQGDLLEPLRAVRTLGLCHAIVCNPPYVTTDALRTLPPQVRAEPMYGLHGGTAGLSFYQRLVPQGAQWLRKHGLLALEIGFDQAKQVLALIRKQGSVFSPPRLVQDLNNTPRVVLAVKQ